MSGIIKTGIETIYDLSNQLLDKYSKTTDTVHDLAEVDGSQQYDVKVPSANAVKQASITIDEVNMMIDNKLQPILSKLEVLKQSSLLLQQAFNSITVEESSVIYDTVKAIKVVQDQQSSVIIDILENLSNL